MSEGLDRIETKMSRMFKWTIFLIDFHDPIIGSSHSDRFLILVFALDEDRLSDRKLFPKELKGKSW